MNFKINNHCKDKYNVEVSIIDNNNITIEVTDRNAIRILAKVKAGSTITLGKDYARVVCSVGSCGLLSWYGCDYSFGVRPFCISDSSLRIDVKGDE